jgi:hypothetical protein
MKREPVFVGGAVSVENDFDNTLAHFFSDLLQVLADLVLIFGVSCSREETSKGEPRLAWNLEAFLGCSEHSLDGFCLVLLCLTDSDKFSDIDSQVAKGSVSRTLHRKIPKENVGSKVGDRLVDDVFFSSDSSRGRTLDISLQRENGTATDDIPREFRELGVIHLQKHQDVHHNTTTHRH